MDGCRKFRPTEIRSPDRPALSESLYRLHYPGTPQLLVHLYIIPATVTRLYLDKPHMNCRVMYSPLERLSIYDKASINYKVMYPNDKTSIQSLRKDIICFKIQRRAATTGGWGWGEGTPPSHEYRTARVVFHEEGKQHKTTNYSFLAHTISQY